MMPPSAPASSPDHALEEHLALLLDVEQMMQEENSLLKQTGQAPDDTFIRRKSLLLPRLEASLSALRAGVGRQQELSLAARHSLRDAQRKLHKVLLLDRENEGLLLRCTLHNGGLPSGPLKIGAGQLVRAYGQHRQ